MSVLGDYQAAVHLARDSRRVGQQLDGGSVDYNVVELAFHRLEKLGEYVAVEQVADVDAVHIDVIDCGYYVKVSVGGLVDGGGEIRLAEKQVAQAEHGVETKLTAYIRAVHVRFEKQHHRVCIGERLRESYCHRRSAVTRRGTAYGYRTHALP